MRAVKKNPRVISKRWFLRKASLVSFSLPSTIRLDPCAGQGSPCPKLDSSAGADAYPRSRAILDLGPSLGTRTIPLAGSLHANINFNDAFDGGHLGDVRITLPPDPTATLSTTAVPLLTNGNVTETNAKAPQDDINAFAIFPVAAPTAYSLNVGSPPVTISGLTWNADAATCGAYTFASFVGNSLQLTSAVAQACQRYGDYLTTQIEGASNVGAGNVYVVVAPLKVAKQDDTKPAGIAVNTLFVGDKNEVQVGGFDGLASAGPGLSALNVGPTMVLAYGVDSNGDTVPDSTLQVSAQAHTEDAQGMGGCGDWVGNGAGITPTPTEELDVDLPSQIKATNDPGNNDAVGDGAVAPYASDLGPNPEQDVVLRTGALQLNIAAPNTVKVPGDNEDNPGSTLAAPYTSGTQITVPADDAAAFSPNQTLMITDGFNSDTAKVGPSSSDINGTTGVINLSTTPGADNTLISSANDYAEGSIVNVTGDAVVQKTVGTSGGRANLFGAPINGLAKGNSVDVTVNLATDINSIARQVDAATPPPKGTLGTHHAYTSFMNGAVGAGAGSIVVDDASGFFAGEEIAVGSDSTSTFTDKAVIASISVNTLNLVGTLTHAHADNTFVSYTPETEGNINAYSDCRQAWTGRIRNYLTGIKLVGSLRISPAITADGKIRIAKVNLRTPQPVAESLAACLTPYQLYMEGVHGTGDFGFPLTSPQLGGGAVFDPLIVLAGSSEGVSPAPTVGCNADGGPLDRTPFNVTPNGPTDPSDPDYLKGILANGDAVGVSGTIKTTIKGEVLVGSFDE